MAGLDPAIHVFLLGTKNVDARDEPGHDDGDRGEGYGYRGLAAFPRN